MESPLLARPGAVPAQGPDTGVAAHYGDPFAEQRALARSAGVVDRSHHGVLRITGEDRFEGAVQIVAPGKCGEQAEVAGRYAAEFNGRAAHRD